MIVAAILSMTFNWHPGGYIHETAQEIREAARQDVFVRLECTQGCYSAGTLWIGYVAEHQGCIGRNAKFGFHAPKDDNIGRIILWYPRAMRNWFYANEHGQEIFYATGPQIVAMVPELRLCTWLPSK